MNETIGCTATSEGMTNEQLLVVHMLLGEFKEIGFTKARHGMCVGGDAQFDFMANALNYATTGHPGVTRKGKVWKRMTGFRGQYVLPEKFFLDRNRDIVLNSNVMIATPKEYNDVPIGSGTWATIRYCKKIAKALVIVFPDGSLLCSGNWECESASVVEKRKAAWE